MSVIPFKKRSSSLQFAGGSTELPPAGVRAIGIDLGTTNSVVSWYEPGERQPHTLEYDGAFLVPSMFYYDESTNSYVVGRKAREALDTRPADVVRGTKRSMGFVGQTFASGSKTFTPEEVATIVLEKLVSHPVLQEEISRFGTVWAVITVPAHFDDAARLATIEAAERANIRVLRIVNEPTAAALAYSMFPDVRNLEKETLVVFDFGGGTFDVSVVEREGLVFNVLASEGDVYLGGDDIDAAFAEWLLESVEPKKHPRRVSRDSALFRKLLWHAEQAKIAFQSQGEFDFYDTNLDDLGATLDLTVYRNQFEEIAMPFVQRTLELTEKALHTARRRLQNISRILLVGGSTRMTLVQNMLQNYFPQSFVDARLEPDLAVSWGAAIQAAMILGKEPDTILVDVCSHTLGIGVAEDSEMLNENFMKVSRKFGILRRLSEQQLVAVLGERLAEFNRELQNLLKVAPIIHRNSPLPARRSEFFSTIYDNQKAVHVVVVQGEKPTVGENRLIGSFFFELVQPCPRGTRCEVQLTYDVNGMVHVLARQLGTDNEMEAEFDSRTGEVIGWRAVRKVSQKDHLENQNNLDANDSKNSDAADTRRKHSMLHSLSIADSDSNSQSLENGNVRSLFSVRSSQQSNSPSPQDTYSDVLNGLIARVQRVLEQNPDAELSHFLADYVAALRLARQGADNDAEIEQIEEKIFARLEALEKTEKE